MQSSPAGTRRGSVFRCVAVRRQAAVRKGSESMRSPQRIHPRAPTKQRPPPLRRDRAGLIGPGSQTREARLQGWEPSSTPRTRAAAGLENTPRTRRVTLRSTDGESRRSIEHIIAHTTQRPPSGSLVHPFTEPEGRRGVLRAARLRARCPTSHLFHHPRQRDLTGRRPTLEHCCADLSKVAASIPRTCSRGQAQPPVNPHSLSRADSFAKHEAASLAKTASSAADR